MEKKKQRPLPQTVKQTVDFIYEYLIQHPDGIEFSMNTLGGKTEGHIATILVKRGIITKEYLPHSKRGGVICKYKWVADHAPTKVLYGSIVQEMRDENKKWHSHLRQATQKNASPIESPTMPASVPMKNDVPPSVQPAKEKPLAFDLEAFSAQELWDELKRRGYTIEDNRLVIIKKAYLD